MNRYAAAFYSSRGRKALFRSISTGITLHHLRVGTERSQATLYLHGLLGNGKNVRAMANKLSPSAGLLLDLRGHGLSSSGQPPHNFQSCVQDIQATMTKLNCFPNRVVGHSWGGRVALQFLVAQLRENRPGRAQIKSTWLLDTVPGVAHESVEKVLNAVHSVPLSNVDKKETLKILQDHDIDVSIAQWLVSSMRAQSDGALKWGFDINVAEEMLQDFGKQPFVEMIEEVALEKDCCCTIHLVRGGRNKAWGSDHQLLPTLERLSKQLTKFKLHVIPKAGHWVHVDDLPGLADLFQKEEIACGSVDSQASLPTDSNIL